VRIPVGARLDASRHGVLRLRSCFAERSSYSAQDDRPYPGARPSAPVTIKKEIQGSAVASFKKWDILTRQQEKREVSTLIARLETYEVAEYGPAAYELTQHRHGLEAIQKYDNIQAEAAKEICPSWTKAFFLDNLIHRFPITEQQKRSSLRVIWAAWKCNQADLGMDVQLFELLRSDPAIGCSVVVDELPDDLAMFPKAATLFTLEDVCPKPNSPRIAKWQEQIRHCAGADSPSVKWKNGKPGPVPSVMCVEPELLHPFPLGNWIGPPYQVREGTSWTAVVLGLFSLVTKAGPNGNGVMWRAVQSEPLWSRIVFASLLTQDSKNPPKPPSGTEETRRRKRQLREWVELGLHSKGSYDKLAALRATRLSNLPQPKPFIKSLALDDPDPAVRREAIQVLDSMS
jgi:hypothetical protein